MKSTLKNVKHIELIYELIMIYYKSLKIIQFMVLYFNLKSCFFIKIKN